MKDGNTNSEYRSWHWTNLIKLNDSDGGDGDEYDDPLLIRQYQ
jgi:hypothetical protein